MAILREAEERDERSKEFDARGRLRRSTRRGRHDDRPGGFGLIHPLLKHMLEEGLIVPRRRDSNPARANNQNSKVEV